MRRLEIGQHQLEIERDATARYRVRLTGVGFIGDVLGVSGNYSAESSRTLIPAEHTQTIREACEALLKHHGAGRQGHDDSRESDSGFRSR